MSEQHTNRPVIGISCGDLNGIGTELVLKTFSDNRMLDLCIPVFFGSNKVINFYRKTLPESNLSYQIIKDLHKLNPRQLNVLNCWEEDVTITPGQLTDDGGKYALQSLNAAINALKEGKIDALVTAPLHKKNVSLQESEFTGHTPYLQQAFEAQQVLMLLCAENMKVGLLSEHVPVSAVAPFVTKERIISRLRLMHQSLARDFGIDKPRIAVLGLNPHAGDEGLIGSEEENIIKPAIKDLRREMLVFGPYSADAFFARGQHEKFDAVLAMYHDQGLIPFKSLATGNGVNYTAGLPVIRTSPDHGTAFDIAGKGRADESSFRAAIYACLDIIEKRKWYDENHKNPLRKITAEVLANVEDEKIEE